MPDGGCGTGFLRLTRRAVKAVRAISEAYVDDTGLENRWVFGVGPKQGKLVSEDFQLMDKLQACGITPYLDASMTCAHIGTKKWVGDFSAWLGGVEAAVTAPVAPATGRTQDLPASAPPHPAPAPAPTEWPSPKAASAQA
jgi:hypothetical protein